MSDKKPVLLSGIQPTGHLCIGNYLGALKNWELLQDSHDSIFLIVDEDIEYTRMYFKNFRGRE